MQPQSVIFTPSVVSICRLFKLDQSAARLGVLAEVPDPAGALELVLEIRRAGGGGDVVHKDGVLGANHGCTGERKGPKAVWQRKNGEV
jgi:hypothetical protein